MRAKKKKDKLAFKDFSSSALGCWFPFAVDVVEVIVVVICVLGCWLPSAVDVLKRRPRLEDEKATKIIAVDPNTVIEKESLWRKERREV